MSSPRPIASSPRPSSPALGQYGSPSAPSIQQIPAYDPSSPRPDLTIPAISRRPSSEQLPPNAVPTHLDELTEAQKANIIRRHLLSADDQQRAAVESGIDDDQTSQLGDEEYPVPFASEGGFITSDLYRWAAQQGPSGTGPSGRIPSAALRRSKSLVSVDRTRRASRGEFADGTAEESEGEDGMRVREILEPGGFRRDFVIRRMAENGTAAGAGEGSRFTRSFVDFLSLYGHFGGEDLEDVDEGTEDEEAEGSGEGEEEENFIPEYMEGRNTTLTKAASNALNRERVARGVISERSPLVRRGTNRSVKMDGVRSRSRARQSSVGDHGDATTTQAVMMLLKSFVGTGVLFLGKAFYNGGIVFSTVVLMFIAMISLYSFLLLVRTRLVVHGSFGDIGGILYGKYMRWLILFSIVLAQIGFVAAYTIFVAQNLQAFVMAVSKCQTLIPLPYLIFVQLIVFLPLAMIRSIQKLSGTALVADAFILFGLVYIFSTEVGVLAEHGLADVKAFNSKDFPLLIGTAVFAFEGIGLVIPITESMKDPHKFPRVLTVVMIGVMFLFAGAGVLAYAAYGSAIQTVVFVNLPQDDRFVNAAQFLYSLAILLSTPLQLFPAVRIMENGIFSRSGKYNSAVKWEKNAFRTAVVVGCTLLAWVGASDLDKFVSLIGSVACVPLCFCYPALLHYKACAVTRRQKFADGALFVFGIVAAVYTTSQTIKLLATAAPGGGPTFGNCPSPN